MNHSSAHTAALREVSRPTGVAKRIGTILGLMILAACGSAKKDGAAHVNVMPHGDGGGGGEASADAAVPPQGGAAPESGLGGEASVDAASSVGDSAAGVVNDAEAGSPPADDAGDAGSNSAEEAGAAPRVDCGDWACFPVPNPAGSSELPNPESYTTQADVVLDEVTGLMWQRAASAETYSFAEVEDACSELSLGGHTDWRLPTLIELVSLIDYGSDAPGGTSKTAASLADDGPFFFWSGTRTAGDGAGLWGAECASGHVSAPSQFAMGRVRCVRTDSVRVSSQEHYLKLGTGADTWVRDEWTGLDWQSTATASEYTFEQARSYCAELTLDGGGFRVPSVREILTLIDRNSEQDLLLDESLFMNSERFTWTSALDALAEGGAWFADLRLGNVQNFLVGVGNIVDQPFSVRCVR